MSFFEVKKKKVSAAPLQVRSVPARKGGRGVKWADKPLPDHRVPGETLENKGKFGLTNARVLDREPNGCAFYVWNKGKQYKDAREIGFFDNYGYWCVRKADGFEVRRGSTKAVMRLLTPEQKYELARLRLNARRKGMR